MIFSRKWVLNEIFKSESTSSNDVNGCYGKQIKEEVDVCVAAASRYANNYHAWSHRIWMIQKFMTATPSVSGYWLRMFTKHLNDIF